MQYREIVERLRNKQMTFDLFGHTTNFTEKRFFDYYNNIISKSLGSNDGNWTLRPDISIEETNAGMRHFYNDQLNYDYSIDDHLMSSSAPEQYCFNCGKILYWVFEGNKITLRKHTFCNDNKKHEFISGIPCEYSNPKPFSGSLNVNSNLIICNFFSIPDCPEDEKYSEKYSLNSFAGCYRRAVYKLEKYNVACGQMGNMFIGVYANSSGDSIIIGPTDHKFNGYNKVGKSICLDVWRFEATDKLTLGESYESEIQNQEYRGHVELNVKHGLWTFNHYYEVYGDESPNKIYSRFDLKV